MAGLICVQAAKLLSVIRKRSFLNFCR